MRNISNWKPIILLYHPALISIAGEQTPVEDVISRKHFLQYPWWRHQMETFSALLALCAGNSPVSCEFPSKGKWRGALMFSLICVWINGWVNNRKSGDLRRLCANYDVTVMPTSCEGNHWSSVDCQYKSPVMTQHQMCHVKRAKGKRDQTTFKGNWRDYFRPDLLPLPFCVSPHVLDIGVERYSGENVISNKEDEQHTSKDNPTSQWHIDTDLVWCWLYAF